MSSEDNPGEDTTLEKIPSVTFSWQSPYSLSVMIIILKEDDYLEFLQGFVLLFFHLILLYLLIVFNLLCLYEFRWIGYLSWSWTHVLVWKHPYPV